MADTNDITERTGRNEKCPCDSGKKYKHCCLNKKDRLRTLDIHLPAGSRPAGLRIGRDEILVVDVDGQAIGSEVYIETYYTRPNKHKTLNKLRVGSANTHIDINKELLRFDNFACIDTNTREIPNVGTISVSAVILGFYRQRSDRKAALDLSFSCGFEFRGLNPSQAEKHGLRLLLTAIQADKKFEGNTGVVVDHDLARIQHLNGRKEAILDQFYLPPGFELIYATTDSGSEFAQNRMIMDADRCANVLMEQILGSAETRDGQHVGTDIYGVRFSQWMGNTEELK